MTFRKYQALHDLHTAALILLDHFARDLTPSEASVRIALMNSQSERIPRWKLGLSKDFWTALVELGCSPEKSREEFLFATCMLLLDRFENSQRGGDFIWEWDAFSEAYRSAPDPIRSALMNGLVQAQSSSLVSEEIRLTPTDLTTNAERDILEPLIALARSLTQDEQAYIATLDYGCDVERHLQALQSLLETKDCRFVDTWFPAEVVELASHVPNANGFVGCTALVLVNAIYNDDDIGNAEFRWHQNKLSYHDLPANARKPIMNAFRHLYESDPDWNPFDDQFAPYRLPREAYIPWHLDGMTENFAKSL